MADVSSVLVMMATYNGEEFLSEQIDSVLAQKGVSVQLLIHDDGSTDRTLDICRDYAAKDPRVKVVKNQHNLGAFGNFFNMMYEVDFSSADYFAFCDQDDVWDTDKVFRAVGMIEDAFSTGFVRYIAGVGTPAIYCSDICDVDIDLTNPRYELRSAKIDMSARGNPLINNWFSGCTMVMNGDLLKLIQTSRPETNWWVVHDQWSFLAGYYCGIAVIDTASAKIKRRIGSHNASGERNIGLAESRASISHLRGTPSKEKSSRARDFYSCYQAYIGDYDRAIVERFLRNDESLGCRIRNALSADFRMPSIRARIVVAAKFLMKWY